MFLSFVICLPFFDLTGKTALVTGGTGFLGTAFVEALAGAGASVVVSSRNLANAESCRIKT